MTLDGQRNVLLRGEPISIDPHLGLELGYKGIVFLRGGIMNIQRVLDVVGYTATTSQANFGVGIKIKNINIDYAYTDIGDNSVVLYSNVISIRLDINKQTK
jgi:hypothetical protein